MAARTIGWLGGIGIGAGLMYLLDPQSGRRRRAIARDKARHGQRVGKDFARKATLDLQHRAEGLAAEMRARFEPREISDEVLVERIRSAMGRLVSHPHSIEVRSGAGRVTLSGPILEHEAPALLRLVARMPQVESVEDRLERHDQPGRVPGLQGGQERRQRVEWLQENWAPSMRVLGGAAGSALALWGLGRRGVVGGAATGLGAALVLRAATNLPLERLVGVGAGRRAIDVQKHIQIAAPVEEVFGFLRDLANYPRFMEHVRTVTVHQDGRSHWVVSGPAGLAVAWDAEITSLRDNEIIAWKSLPGAAVQNAGIIRLEPDGDGGTRVDIRMSYNPPAGAVGHAIASLFGTDPRHAMNDDLLRLKSLLEVGKTSAHGERVTRDELRRNR